MQLVWITLFGKFKEEDRRARRKRSSPLLTYWALGHPTWKLVQGGSYSLLSFLKYKNLAKGEHSRQYKFGCLVRLIVHLIFSKYQVPCNIIYLSTIIQQHKDGRDPQVIRGQPHNSLLTLWETFIFKSTWKHVWL